MINSIFFNNLVLNAKDDAIWDIEIHIPVCSSYTNDIAEFARTISAILTTSIPYEFILLIVESIPGEMSAAYVTKKTEIFHAIATLKHTHYAHYCFLVEVLESQHLAVFMCKLAAKYGLVDCLEHTKNAGYYYDTFECIDIATNRGHLQVVDYLKKHWI